MQSLGFVLLVKKNYITFVNNFIYIVFMYLVKSRFYFRVIMDFVVGHTIASKGKKEAHHYENHGAQCAQVVPLRKVWI